MRIDQTRPFGLYPWAAQRTNIRAPRGPRRNARPDRVTDVAVHWPRVLIYGRSIAPQTGGGGMVHIVARAVTFRVDGDPWLFARWVCGGHSVYAQAWRPARTIVGDPPGPRCERCRRLYG